MHCRHVGNAARCSPPALCIVDMLMDHFLSMIGALLFLFAAIYFLNLHLRTKSKIDEWANKSNFTIIKKKYVPYYRYGVLVGGMHPAHFKVSVRDKDENISDYSIAGGGRFWLSDQIDISEAS